VNQDLQLISQGENQEILGPFGRLFIGDFPTKGTLWIIVLAILVDAWIAGGLLSFLLLSIISIYLAIYFGYNYIEPHFNTRIGVEREKKLSQITKDPNHLAMGDIGRLLHGYGKSAVGQVWDLSGTGKLSEMFGEIGHGSELDKDSVTGKVFTWLIIASSWICTLLIFLLLGIPLVEFLELLGFSENVSWELMMVLVYIPVLAMTVGYISWDGNLSKTLDLFKIDSFRIGFIFLIGLPFVISVIDIVVINIYDLLYIMLFGTPSIPEIVIYYEDSEYNLLLALSFTSLVIAAPVVEEILFRGYILDAIREIHGDTVAILGSAGLFGLLHLEPYVVGMAALGGVIYGWIRIKTGSLWPSIVSHMVWNFLAFLYIWYG
jgi:hypothetical protein